MKVQRDQGWEHLRDIEGTESNHLRGKTIAIAASGSVAVLEIHRLARGLMRHGARVQFFLTPAATELVSVTSLEWCTGSPVVSRLTGRCEHLEFFGTQGRADLLLLAPTTANTLAKLVHGIDDNAVTTAATTAIGRKMPIFCCPGMHEPMFDNPAVVRNLAALDDLGVELLAPTRSEGKAKMMDVTEIIARVLRRLGPSDLKGKRVLLTGGPTREYIDPARCLTNPSSGLSACLLAAEAFRRGAEVTLVYGPGTVQPSPWIEVRRVETGSEMLDAVVDLLSGRPIDIALAVAAVCDFRPDSQAAFKRPTSDGAFELQLHPTPKILDEIRRRAPSTVLVAFKASTQDNDEGLICEASRYLEEDRADWVVGNSVLNGQGFEAPNNRYLLCRQGREPEVLGPADKRLLAGLLWDRLSAQLLRS